MPNAQIQIQVKPYPMKFEDKMLTFALASGIVAADVGKAVAIDTSADCKVKLAGNGDVIFGRLESVENRVNTGQLLGAVALEFVDLLPVADGATIARGDTAVGAGGGAVKRLEGGDPVASTPDYRHNVVLAVVNGFAVVSKI